MSGGTVGPEWDKNGPNGTNIGHPNETRYDQCNGTKLGPRRMDKMEPQKDKMGLNRDTDGINWTTIGQTVGKVSGTKMAWTNMRPKVGQKWDKNPNPNYRKRLL
jgi:hypothetical protein